MGQYGIGMGMGVGSSGSVGNMVVPQTRKASTLDGQGVGTRKRTRMQ